MQRFPQLAADRLTQLQDAVNLQAENFCNSIGALQATAKESPFPEFRMNKNDSNNESSDADCVNENNNNNNNNNQPTVDLINSKLSMNEMVASSLLNASGNVSSSSPSSSTTTSTPATTTTATTSTMSSPSSKLSSPSPLVSSQQLDQNNDDKISAKPTSNNGTNDVNIDSNDSNNTPTTSSAPVIQEDYSQMFARLVARTAKDIDTLVESLPNTFESEAGSSDLHSESIKQLEEENAECIVKLERAIEHGESILDMIREALDDIAMTQFRSQNLDEFEQN